MITAKGGQNCCVELLTTHMYRELWSDIPSLSGFENGTEGRKTADVWIH